MARMDTRDTRDLLLERYPSGGRTFTRTVIPPEETTTFNLVRRLAYWQARRGGLVAATLHSRALEGGLDDRRLASGADLEMAVEVTPGTWIDLLLQAKRIFEHQPGPSGVYDGWKADQINDLRYWAAHNGDRTPGMLLYNAEISPFGAPGHDVNLGACEQNLIRCHGWRWPQWMPPDRRSPLGVTLVILPKYGTPLPPSLSRDALAANVVNQYASPLECIFCPGRLTGSAVTLHRNDRRVISAIEPKDAIPQWANTLLAAVTQDLANDVGAQSSSDDEPWDARYSLVLPYTEQP
jgi:hypothetical protein